MNPQRKRVEANVDFNPDFREVNSCRKRYRILKGSAGSGKSVNIAQDYILKLMDPKYQSANLLVIRKVEESNRDSTYAELTGAIHRIFGEAASALWEIKLSPLKITSKVTGNSIIFRGVNDDRQREKIKSITFKNGKLTWIWIEEATELAEPDVDILDDRLRGVLDNPNLFYQITMTFNPVSATHWIKRKYFDIQHPDIFTHHSTYLANRFIDAAFHQRMELRRIQDPEGYVVYGLGEWGETGGLILTRYEVHQFDTRTEFFDSMVIGQDFGFNHANAILLIGIKDGDLYVCSEIYEYEKDTSELIILAKHRDLPRRIRMLCDSAEPDRIQMWKRAGYNAMPAVKGPGSVQAQIDYLKQRKIHIHPSCVNTTKEIQQWKWKKDTKTGSYTDEPVDIVDDAMAALRYAISDRVQGRSNIKAKIVGRRVF